MTLLIGFLTFLMVINCLLLMLLVLIQLPKKEAGAGIAFGGGATDALFGAGSGNALTKMTKYSASIFVGMSLFLSMLNSHSAKAKNRLLEEELLKKANAPAPTLATPAATPQTAATTQVVSTPNILTTTAAPSTTNATPILTAPATTIATPPPSAEKQTVPSAAPATIPPAAPATNPPPGTAPK